MLTVEQKIAADIIAALSNEIDALRKECDTTQKWGQAGWKRWLILADAAAEAAKVEQEL